MTRALMAHQTTYRIIYGDTDNMGFTYYGNYLRLFEIGRTEMFRNLGLCYTEIEKKGIYLPVSEAFCKYKHPARYDDIVVIETSLDTDVKAGMKFDYTIHNQTSQKISAFGYTKHAYLNREGRVVRPPGFMKDLVAELGRSA